MPVPPRQPAPPFRSARPGGSGPGRSGAPVRPARSRPARAATGRASAPAPKPRLTGRAAILVLVLAVLAVSYASSLRAYLQQRTQIDSLQSTISERQAQIDDLEQEKDRWLDPQFVETEARERLGYVMPGETPYVVLRDGKPLETESELSDPHAIAPAEPRAVWDDAWQTMLIAGDPQARADPPPLTKVESPDGAGE